MNLEQIETKAKNNNVPVLRTKSQERLVELVKTKNPKTILEFGTAVGVSAILMLNASNATIDTIEIDQARAHQAEENLQSLNLANRANVLVGDAIVLCEQLQHQNKKYDFVFLDSAKGQYVKLLPHILNLLNPGGVLVADNVLFRGYVYGNCPKRFKTISKRLKQFIENCKSEKQLKDVEVINIEDGLLVATKVQLWKKLNF